ncbi:MAG TPA: flagellar motor switch protein FliN [Holophagaceae bacterium]|nr:flagellar motor switch protein FliN [Holophagaceae bacterium]
MDPKEQEFYQKVGEVFTEAMGSVFGMLTGRDFHLTAEPAKTLDAAPAVAGLLSGQSVFVKAHYQKGVTGTLYFALPLKEGTMLVDLMLGGDGAASDSIEGDSKDALAETFNQAMGSANQSFSDQAGETFSISNVEIGAFAAEAGPVGDWIGTGPFQAIPIDTKQDGIQAKIFILMPDLLAQQFQRKLGFAASAPAPAPEAPAAAPRAAAAPAMAAAPMASGPAVDPGNLDLLLDIELQLVVRMGQTEMQMGELLKLTPGAILEMNRSADAPVELLVNGKLIAKGEVVVVDGNFAFRITEIESKAARIRSLG